MIRATTILTGLTELTALTTRSIRSIRSIKRRGGCGMTLKKHSPAFLFQECGVFLFDADAPDLTSLVVTAQLL